jgi:phosphoribosyl 1,2-cyclic phosphodiesterase
MSQTAPMPINGSIGVCVLASGSKGNAIYVGCGRTAILVDAGLSGKEIEKRFASAGLSPKTLNAVVVSHEHSDHIRGVGIIARRYHLPVYISAKTARAAASQLGRVDELCHFDIGASFVIGDMEIHPFATSHDATDSAGFTIAHNGRKIGIATDLGIATGLVKYHLKQCALLILEANHDPSMLADGPYPWPLKQRIKSRDGHLSNNASRDLLTEIRHDGLRHVILAHLSETNNSPQKVMETIQPAVGDNCGNIQLHMACQDHCTQVIVID